MARYPAPPPPAEADPVALAELAEAQAALDAAIATKQDSATAATGDQLAQGLALKQSRDEKGQPDGYAALGADGKVPPAQSAESSRVLPAVTGPLTSASAAVTALAANEVLPELNADTGDLIRLWVRPNA